jgi:hypothetical protein
MPNWIGRGATRDKQRAQFRLRFFLGCDPTLDGTKSSVNAFMPHLKNEVATAFPKGRNRSRSVAPGDTAVNPIDSEDSNIIQQLQVDNTVHPRQNQVRRRRNVEIGVLAIVERTTSVRTWTLKELAMELHDYSCPTLSLF